MIFCLLIVIQQILWYIKKDKAKYISIFIFILYSTPINLEEYKLFCKACETHVSNRAKHCKVCNRCVNDFDHHCDWLNNCIGKKNCYLFYILVISSTLHSFIQISGNIFLFVTLRFTEYKENLKDFYNCKKCNGI